jgi:hypothetical protein
MNTEIKEKWIEALKSGEYSQAQNTLRDGNCFCCLGVLCDVIDKTKWKPDRYPLEESKCPMLYEGVEIIPPRTVIDKAGLKIEQCQILAEMNDGGSSFTEIADYIEKRL